jgi:Glycosyltransferase family 87
MRGFRFMVVPDAVLAAAAFAAVALAATGIVRASGQQIVDTGRYQGWGQAVDNGLVPYRDFDVEYPPGALPFFALPELAVSGASAYFWAFAAQMALFGAVGVVLTGAALRRLDRTRNVRWAVLAALAVSPAAFAGVVLTRFDLVPAVLVAGALLLFLHERPRWGSLALGAGAAVKLYPLALLPLLAVWTWRRRGRREASIAVALVLGVVALAYLPFVLLAPDEVASSLWRQLSRPLQIESLGAGMLVILHHVAGVEVTVEQSRGSHNLVGATADATAWALALTMAAAVCALWIRFARGDATPERLVRYVAAVLLAFVALGKVLSPQFLLWLLLPLALVAGRRGAAAGASFAIAAVATAVWFPALYFDLPHERDPLVASLVVLRGLALVGALAVLAWPREGLRAPRWSLRRPEAADARP